LIIIFLLFVALKQWKSAINFTQNKFQVTIIPLIDCVDENSIDTRPDDSNGHADRSRSTTIKLRDDWALIAGHRNFKVEYKEFIRNYLSSFQSEFIFLYLRSSIRWNCGYQG
jgi:hypothetical protein